jgi:hypothetical protein
MGLDRAGQTAAMSRRCWSCSPREARSRSLDGLDGNGFGTSLNVSTQLSSLFPPPRLSDSGRSAGFDRSALRALRPLFSPASRPQWEMRASP